MAAIKFLNIIMVGNSNNEQYNIYNREDAWLLGNSIVIFVLACCVAWAIYRFKIDDDRFSVYGKRFKKCNDRLKHLENSEIHLVNVVNESNKKMVMHLYNMYESLVNAGLVVRKESSVENKDVCAVDMKGNSSEYDMPVAYEDMRNVASTSAAADNLGVVDTQSIFSVCVEGVVVGSKGKNVTGNSCDGILKYKKNDSLDNYENDHSEPVGSGLSSSKSVRFSEYRKGLQYN